MLKKLTVLFAALMLGATGVAAHAQTNYPVAGTLVLTDAQGGTIEDGVCVGDVIQVRATGWAPLTDAKAEYFSDAVQLGTFKSNSSGEVNFQFQVPNAQPVPGTHTFRLSGTGSDGKPRTVEAAIKCLKCGQQPGTGTGTGTGSGSGAGSGTGAGNASGSGSGTGGGSGTGSGSGAGSGTGVLGRTVDSSRGGSTSGSAFGKTGSDLLPLLEAGLTLFAIGAVLVLAVRKRRAADALSS